jgi:hypothetical protein
VLSEETVIPFFEMGNTGRISGNDNLIVFENLDIPIAIEVPRFPLLYVLSFLFFGFLVLFSVNNFVIVTRYMQQSEVCRLKPKNNSCY